MKLKIVVSTIIFCVAILAIFIGVNFKSEGSLDENKKIADIFDSNDIIGTFVIYDPKIKIFREYNASRARERFVPASIFKIANAYIALSEGDIGDVDEIFFWYDGSDFFLETWEQDSSLRMAMKHSNVPAFQQLAREIGIEKYQSYLTNYGNNEVGTVVDLFWLEGPLAISAVEQTLYMSGIIEEDSSILPLLKDILFQEEINGWKLYAKTGTTKEIGWFAGFVEKGEAYYSFAFNMDLPDLDFLPLRHEVPKEILRILDL